MKPVRVLFLIAVLGATRMEAQPFGLSEPEFRVNTYTSGYQGWPVVAPYSLGGFVVAWYGDNEIAGQSARVNARLFSALLNPGAEFHVGAFTTQQQFKPSVAGSLSAQYVISWFAPESGAGLDVFAQRFQANATLGGAIRVNTITPDDQRVPSVASDGTDGFVVAWSSSNQGNSTTSVWGKRFTSAGLDLTPEFAFGNFTTTEQVNPVVARNQAGRFVVAFQGKVGATNAIFAHPFSSAGFSLGAEFNVSGVVDGAVYPAVAISPSGEFVVAWTAPDNDALGVFAVRYSQYGYPHGTPFRINTYTTSDQGYPSIAFDSEENFVVVWHSQGQDGSGYGVFAQRFSSTGSPLSGEFRLNAYTTAEQVLPRITATQFGDFIVTWSSSHVAATERDIYVRRLCGNLAGDANADGTITVSDILYLINYLFAGGPPPQRVCDVDGNNATNVSDVLYLINYLFAGGPPPHCATFDI